MDIRHIRNFTIIGHIDHGKSTLADRLLELTGTIPERSMREQVLDQLAVERERGITVKLKTVRMHYTCQDTAYILNVVDTPGHVDFSHEVSRSLAAVEGALLVVDATQGIQAQTIANTYLARTHNLTIIPLINKIDLPNANVQSTGQALKNTFGFSEEEIIEISAKHGTHVLQVVARLIRVVPPPSGDPQKPLTALIFDSRYDVHKGVVVSVRVFDGSVARGQQIFLMGAQRETQALEVGMFGPSTVPMDALQAGEVGYIATGLKDITLAQIGDTVTRADRKTPHPLPGYLPVKPLVFVGIFPVNTDDYLPLREALGKLKLSDAALNFTPESSRALGNGFRCGFLGLLHAEVTQQRLEEEFGLNLIMSLPTVAYRIDGKEVANPLLVELTDKRIEEPWVAATMYTPSHYIGAIVKLCNGYRGSSNEIDYVGSMAKLTYEMPLQEFMSGFYDRLKSVSQGYASLDYEFVGYRPTNAVRLDILINKEPIDAFSQIVVHDKILVLGRELVEKLKEVIPRQQFEVPIQAAISGRIVARATIPAYRKDVTAKLYGGDRTRKDKLLEAQKKGKSRLKSIGRVQIPQEAFFTVFRRG